MNALHQWDINHVINPQGRQRRSDNRNSVALIITSNPEGGESLLASTEQPVYRLEPSPEERGPGERWSPSLRDKVLIKREQCQMHLNIAEREGLRRSQRGDGGVFEKSYFQL